MQFRTANGVLAHINTNWLTPFKARSVTVATRGKYVMGDLLTRQVTECFGFKPDGSYSMRHLPVGHDEPLRAELIAFLKAVRNGETPAVTGDEGVASLEIATQCLETPSRPRPRRQPARARAASPAETLSMSTTQEGAKNQTMNQHLRSEPIPFIDVASQRRRLGASLDEAVKRVLDHCQFVNGPEVFELEKQLAAYCGAKHVVACANGTDALLMVLMAKDVGPGDAVLCPSFTFIATASPSARTGATPVYVDVDETTFNMSPESLKRGIAAARKARPEACRGHSGRSVRPACRLRRHRRDRQGRRPVRDRRRRARFWRKLQGSQARHLRRSPPRPASSRPSRSAASATAARSSPMTTSWRRRCAACACTGRASTSTTMSASA